MPHPHKRTRSAPAKLNLGLHILSKRADGYHEIDTVMTTIGWYDHLEWSDEKDFTFECTDLNLATDTDNLCVSAAYRLASAVGIEPYGRLLLRKYIPMGAGLGGGSSDAAHTLMLLKDAWQIDVSERQLLDIAASLGSDVPFFIAGKTQRATGRGEQLMPVDTPEGVSFPVAVVMPDVHISTAEAYASITPNSHDRPDLADAISSGDPDRWRRELVNDFEAPIIRKYPEIGKERDVLYARGARYAAMSGSGAAVFGLFDTVEESQIAAQQAIERGLRSWAGVIDL